MPALPPTRSSLASRVASGYRQILDALCLLLALWIVVPLLVFQVSGTQIRNNIIGLDPNNPPATFGSVTAVTTGGQRQAQIAVRYRF